MKIDFEIPSDGKMHRYCLNCMSQEVGRETIDGKTVYPCRNCGSSNNRTLYFNTHKYWVDQDRELWHESSGVFVRNAEGKYLFYQRNEYPYSLTVPSGHVDIGETPEGAAQRELAEETDISGELQLVATDDVVGDSCSAGADVHRWHAFSMTLSPSQAKVQIHEEGDRALWLSLQEAQEQGVVFVVDYIISKYGKYL